MKRIFIIVLFPALLFAQSTQKIKYQEVDADTISANHAGTKIVVRDTLYVMKPLFVNSGLSSFGVNSGTVTIPSGSIAKVYIAGLTSATGKATLSIQKNGFITVSDTLPSWYVPSNDTLYIRYKYNEAVSYFIGSK